MTAIRLTTASNVRSFQTLLNALATSGARWKEQIDREGLEDEFGRFRVWSGNLGALQKGHSSLDYRLRDSPLLSGNALRFLEELNDNLNEALAVISGIRLPYEEESKPDSDEQKIEENDDGFFSEDDEDEDEDGGSKKELTMRYDEVVDIIDNLYKLSVRIRTPTIRSRSLKAASYQPKDPETGVDILSTYAHYDQQHTRELLHDLRKAHSSELQGSDDYLVARLARGITLRRRHFKYWRRHRDKLSMSNDIEEGAVYPRHPPDQFNALQYNDAVDAPLIQPIIMLKQALSQKTAKTMLSGTEATHHHQSLDEIVDTKSVTSYAVTVTDIHGKGVILHPPPTQADGERDFECPYCYIICPARYGRGRPWRTHLLQDLQPYICTYPDCEASEQLFRSRREWHDHEAGHRKVWRCPEHPLAVYKSPSGLENHLRQQHFDSFPESQLDTIVKIGETSTIEVRDKCPICLMSADAEGIDDFANHVANHLERIAAFALPNSSEEDADGASSAASRGKSGSTASQDVSGMSLPSEVSNEQSENEALITELRRDDDDALANKPKSQEISSHTLLSLESLQSLPDISHSRLDTLMSNHAAEQDNDDEGGGDFEVVTADFEDHMQRMEDFKTYLMSLPNAQYVRFFKRYGSWRGYAIFSNSTRAAQAVQSFDTRLYPDIKVQQSAEGSRNKLKFSAPNTQETRWHSPARQLTSDMQNSETKSNASNSMIYDDPERKDGNDIMLSVSDIPTLRDMYRSRKPLQRDLSFAPNDSYNRMISFCYHDLTRLKVDAIVNSANNSLNVSKHGTTLNHSIHKAGGPGLTEEAKLKGKLKSGQATLTGGHNLPCTHVIHVARPQYGANKGTGQFNVLTECYRSALRIAQMYGLKTIAFPCLGAGGCGFPPRVAARVALQEVREFLDFDQDPPFERLIFVVYSASDEKAYTDLFPAFFPPTHGDLEIARSSDTSANRASLAAQVLEARLQVQKVAEDLSAELTLFISDFPKEILEELHGIDAAFSSIRGFLVGSKALHRSLGDLNLICSVVQTICGSITELTESAKVMPFSGGRSHVDLWDNYNNHHEKVYGHDLEEFLRDCQDFAQYLEDILIRDGVELEEMTPVRLRLDAFKVRQRNQDGEGAREHFDKVLYARESPRETYTEAKDIVRMHQVPSISQLYLSNSLEEKSTIVQPSATFNDSVYFIREDITKLEVAVMVNSTDVTFAGMGTLDRKVFNKGGMEIREACTNLGVCKEGDVKATEGFGLPAKHVLHVVPPRQWRENSKDILRQIYREILYTAQRLRATSLAIPAIGTGMLSYPRQDCAALALGEVRRFLESVEPTSSLEKIILVAYSSSDEFVYKSLLPIYFPSIDRNVNRVLSVSHLFPKERHTPPQTISAPKRTLFSSIGDAVRNLGTSRPGKRSVAHTWRAINTYEEHALIGFELHARDCSICKTMAQLYQDRQNLCEHGYPLAQTLLWYMNLGPDQLVYTRAVQIRQSVRLEVPEDMFPLSLTMLRLVEASLREEGREPFISPNKAFSTVIRGQPAQEDESSGPTIYNAETARASVEVWSASEQTWSPVSPSECIVFIRKGRLDVYEAHAPFATQNPLLNFVLDPAAEIARPLYRNGLVVRGVSAAQFDNNGEIMLVSQSKADSELLLAMLHRANPEFPVSMEELETISKGRVARGADGSVGARTTVVTTLADRVCSDSEHGSHDTAIPTDDAQDSLQGHLSPLQAKMQRLSEAASRFNIESPEQQSATVTQLGDFMDPSDELQLGNTGEVDDKRTQRTLTALEHQILHHLTKDLKSRPGAYIGQSTKNIATALETPLEEVITATASLSRQNYIHSTINEGTWVISRPPQNLPALADRSKGSPTLKATSSTMQTGSKADTAETLFQMDLLEQRILSHLSMFNSTSPQEKGCTTLHIAEALDADLEEVELALGQLAEQGKMYLAPDGETWNTPLSRQYFASAGSSHDAARLIPAQANIRGPKDSKDTPPSPVFPATTTQISALPAELDISNLDEPSLYLYDPATR